MASASASASPSGSGVGVGVASGAVMSIVIVDVSSPARLMIAQRDDVGPRLVVDVRHLGVARGEHAIAEVPQEVGRNNPATTCHRTTRRTAPRLPGDSP